VEYLVPSSGAGICRTELKLRPDVRIDVPTMTMWVKRSGLFLFWAFYDGFVRADPHAAFLGQKSSNPHAKSHARQGPVEPTSRIQPLQLFFNSSVRGRKSLWTIPGDALDRISQSSISFPTSIDLKYEGQKQFEGKHLPKSLVIRNINKSDLPELVPMCVKEFGRESEVQGFPWKNLTKESIQAWLDSVMFGPLISMSLEMKIQRQIQGDTSEEPDDTILCLEEEGKIIGIVELSMQPLDAERNPPPVPLPLWYKLAYSQSKNLPPPDGWVSNLLIAEEYRGRGYSKVMMKAVEGLARSWGCTSISLHVDADHDSGKVAQSLYKSLGYKPVLADTVNHKFDWMGPELLQMGLYMIDGVPLLFLRKDLEKAESKLE